MKKKNRVSLLWRLAVTATASLCFTTLALPLSQMRMSHRVKLVSKVASVPLRFQSDQHTKADLNFPNQRQVSPKSEELDARMLSEYGAVMKAGNGAVAPFDTMFSSDEEVEQWQANVKTAGGDYVLQLPAAEALGAARAEAHAQNLDITPRDTDAAARNYAYTVKLWMSRVNPALDHWVRKGKLSLVEAQRIRALPSRAQAIAVLGLEKQGMFFSKDFSKSILYSVAPPGASQHLALLAFDVKEHQDPRVREILARHGWYQTVQSDQPHFTYLGVNASELPSLGLVSKSVGGRVYWIPGATMYSDSSELIARR